MKMGVFGRLYRSKKRLGVLLLLGAGLLGGAAGTEPDVTEGNIAKATSGVLEHSQFAHHPLDSELASRFLDFYLDALDPSHMLFLQSDLDEFSPYRQKLGELTRQEGDTAPAHVIFKRHLERLGQQVNYVTNLLHQNADFDFSGTDTYNTSRDTSPRPADLKAAQAVWRERLRYEYLQELLGGKSHAEIEKSLAGRYERALLMRSNFSKEEILELYLDALAHVYDPHSDYMNREQYKSFAISMNLSLSGIGATLQSEDGYCLIKTLVTGGPAARSGELKPGDRIISTQQKNEGPVDLVGMPLTRAVEYLRGPKGSEVIVTVIPADASDDSVRKSVTLVRDEIHLEDQRAKARVIDYPLGNGKEVRMGVIDLPSFYGDSDASLSATKDVQLLVRKLKALEVKGIILDLRQNGGGSLNEAVSLTGLFIARGPVVQTRDPDGKTKVENDPDSMALYDGPLIVLTSRFSASASEILAGALQDYGRALVVGDSSTFGKGTVQSLMPLNEVMNRKGFSHAYDPGALKVTISKFYRPGGSSTQLKGVNADIPLPSLTDNSKFAESSMKNPLPWDQVAPARFVAVNRVQPYLKQLREKSAQRVAADENFFYLKKEIAELNNKQTNTEVSLNAEVRRKEKEAASANQKALMEKMAASLKSAGREYEISAKNAQQPGLPSPAANSTNTAQSIARKDGAEESIVDRAKFTGVVVLDETKRIMADYISLSKTGT